MRALAAVQHFRHYTAQMTIAGDADFELPNSRHCEQRTVSTVVSKGGVDAQRAPPGYCEEHITTEKVHAAIERGTRRCEQMLTHRCGFKELLDVADRQAFF